MTSPHYLIIGNGAAGVSAAEAIRRRDARGRITILSDEPYRMYSRPGIAYYLLNQVSEQQVMCRSQNFYQTHQFNLLFRTVTSLDVTHQLVHLENGQTIAYDVLMLATGAKATPPTFPGNDLEGVFTLDTLDNAKRIVASSRKAKTAVVIGGGITAMEMAEGMRRQGLQTHFLQRGSRLWPRLFDERESGVVEQQIRHEGIHLHYNEEIVEAYGKNGKVAGVRLQSGREIKCQMIGAAIGVKPNMTLVHGLPIEQQQGILVNEHLQSSLPTLFAAGDVAQAYDRWTKTPQLDILWPTALQTGQIAGHNMVDVAYGRKPSATYQKSSPFNAALLFGVHVTVIGRIGVKSDRGENEVEQISHLSRGASQIWTAPFAATYRSAWDNKGDNSVRITVQDNTIVGALLMGNQELADPLRHLIDQQILVPTAETLLATGSQLPHVIATLWQSHLSSPPLSFSSSAQNNNRFTS
ncbi:MAG: FAD-dependent oxidoreductase [Anaerolinea sp.]|nr:FAD-dependent oxidoreductase [Anaerolinea sp.]